MSMPWEDFAAPASGSTAASGPWDDFKPPQETPDAPGQPDLLSKIYHPVIEGAGMTVGGAAGAAAGSPAGPIGAGLAGFAGAAAMYPPAHAAANSLDKWRGINTDQQPNQTVPQQLGEAFKQAGTGAEIEAGGMLLKPVAGALGNILPGARAGEAISGTPASNLRRAYKQGFSDTYLNPSSLSETTPAYAEAKNKLMSGYMSPEDQASMLINPRGEANQKISDIYTKWLKGEPITAQDAVSTRNAIDTVYPAGTAKNEPRIAKFAEFKTALNGIIGEENPKFKAASDAYAASKLRSQLMKPARVNKSNPDDYSKLAAMLYENAGGIASFGTHSFMPMLGATAAMVGTSPLAMGTIASAAGSIARSGLGDPVRRALMAAYLERNAGQANNSSQTGPSRNP